ncbi:MAG: 3-isopropylmalate dehydratase small subunit [Bacteroidaceae bacterium]|nr:3-isopropylmalate dehydratase small subunit [Bacteroidaceae bacterium]
MSKQKFDIIQSTCLPIEIDNCNTDLIIPARYLASTTRDPKFFGDAFMHDLRYDAEGKPMPDFVMNQPAYSEAPRKGVHEIIIGGQNWGSGSSREHAAWAIAGYGVRVVISSSFADIHRNNLLNCFVLPVVVSREFQQELFQTVKDNPKAEVKVDVPNQTVTNLTTGRSEQFPINSYKKYCLMNAYDDIDFLLSNTSKIEEYEKEINCKWR